MMVAGKVVKIPFTASAPTEFALGYDMIDAPKAESFCRLTRKDFWNDPERWDGIEDPRQTMIWDVRRPDRIDITPTKPVGEHFACNSAGYQEAMMQQAKFQSEMQYVQYQSQLQAASLMNTRQSPRSMFWPFL